MNENSPTKSKFLHDILLSIKLNTAVINILDLDIQVKKAVSKLIFFVETEDLNKLYVFTVEILDSLYENNLVLSEINIQPIWKTIKILDSNYNDDIGYAKQQAHINELKRIWILEKRKNDIVELSPKELRFLEKINDEIQSTKRQLDKQYKKREQFIIDQDKIYFKLERYDNYALYINGHYLIKPRNGAGENIIDRCMKFPNKKIEVGDLKNTQRIETILNSMKFNAKLRRLFFPSIGKTTIFFRPKITGKDIIKEQIDIRGLEDWLT